VGAEPVGERLDPRDAVVAAFGDDVGSPVLQRELLAWFVAAHRDDPLRAQLLGGQHGEQADRAVTDHGDRLAGSDLRRDRTEPAGAEHIRGGQEARDQVHGRHLRAGDQSAVGQRNPHPLRLRALSADALPVDTGRLVAGSADLAGVVGGEERLPGLPGSWNQEGHRNHTTTAWSYDDLSYFRVSGNFVGILRALVSGLDCLAACIVGVAALPTPMVTTTCSRRSTFWTASTTTTRAWYGYWQTSSNATPMPVRLGGLSGCSACATPMFIAAVGSSPTTSSLTLAMTSKGSRCSCLGRPS
jgi:hypothetical protein